MFIAYDKVTIQACMILNFSYLRYTQYMKTLLEYTSECWYSSDMNILVSNIYIASINKYIFVVIYGYIFKPF